MKNFDNRRKGKGGKEVGGPWIKKGRKAVDLDCKKRDSFPRGVPAYENLKDSFASQPLGREKGGDVLYGQTQSGKDGFWGKEKREKKLMPSSKLREGNDS